MSAESDLYTALQASSAVTAIIGAGNVMRAWPDITQPDSLPAVAYARTNTEFFTSIHVATPVAERSTFEVACLALNRPTAESLANAVVAAVSVAGFTVTGRSFAEPSEEQAVLGTLLTLNRFIAT